MISAMASRTELWRGSEAQRELRTATESRLLVKMSNRRGGWERWAMWNMPERIASSSRKNMSIGGDPGLGECS